MKEYILQLDKRRRLKFGFGAARLLREKLGDRELDDILKMKIDEMPAVAWAGLVWEDPTLTVEQVEKLLDEKIPDQYSIVKIINIITAAIAQDLGIEPEKKKTDSQRKESSPSPSGSRTSNLKS